MKKTCSLILAFTLAACAAVQDESAQVIYGKILEVTTHSDIQQQVNLTGAVAGGVTGGVVGHQFGKGKGKTAMTVLGAVAGAVVGSQVGKRETIQQASRLTLQMPDGSILNITMPRTGFKPGQTVKIVQQGHRASIESIAPQEEK